MQQKMEKEAKKEAFRKYLESAGVIDALTKVLVALYEQNDKPSSAIEFIQQKMGGPTVSEFEKLQADLADLQAKYDKLKVEMSELQMKNDNLSEDHEETCRKLKENKDLPTVSSSLDTLDEEVDGLQKLTIN